MDGTQTILLPSHGTPLELDTGSLGMDRTDTMAGEDLDVEEVTVVDVGDVVWAVMTEETHQYFAQPVP